VYSDEVLRDCTADYGWQSSVQFSVQFPDEWITVQCRNICRLELRYTWTVLRQRHSQLQQKPVDVWLPAQQRSLIADESQELELSCGAAINVRNYVQQ